MMPIDDPRGASARCHRAIEALRRGRAPDLTPCRRQDASTVAAVRVATRLAMGAGRAPHPRSAFVARIERRLLARQAAYVTERGASWRPSPLSRWPRPVVGARLALTLLALLAVATLVVRGPSQALADVRRLLSYVPGLGFFTITIQPVRVLEEPVALTRDGVTVRVEQVIAGAHDTRLVVTVEADAMAADREAMVRVPDAGIALRTASGIEIPLTEWAQSPEGVVLTFAPLPTKAGSVVLTMREPPGLPADEPSDEWTFRLTLRGGPDVGGDMHLKARLVESYVPAAPTETHHGLTLRVLDVAHTVVETVVRVGIEGYPRTDLGMSPHLGGRLLPTLRDDAGRAYAARPAPGVGFEAGAVVAPATGGAATDEGLRTEQVLAFEPIHPTARDLTLAIDGVAVEVPADGEFWVDLGDAPQVGDVFPVDLELHVAGATLRLTRATLAREELVLRDGTLVRTVLRFDAEQVTPRDEAIVNSLTLVSDRDLVRGSSSHGGPEGIRDVAVEFVDDRVPSGPLAVRVQRAGVILLGPWEFTWRVPAEARP